MPLSCICVCLLRVFAHLNLTGSELLGTGRHLRCCRCCLFLYRPTVHGLGFLRIAKLANNPAQFANDLIICIYFAAIFVKPSLVKVVAYHTHILYSFETKDKRNCFASRNYAIATNVTKSGSLKRKFLQTISVF